MSGIVERRAGESYASWRQRYRIAQRVETVGLHVECQTCGAKGRHKPEQDGPLRFRHCPKCGSATLKRRARR